VIPQLVTVRYRRSDGHWTRLFVPVLPVLVLLSPLLVLGGVIASLAAGVRFVGVLRVAWQLLWALPGTQFGLEYQRTAVHVNVR
jgi:hypothetical protein